MAEYTGVCIICGGEFIKRRNAQVCGVECRTVWQAWRKAGAYCPLPRPCVVCDSVFKPYTGKTGVKTSNKGGFYAELACSDKCTVWYQQSIRVGAVCPLPRKCQWCEKVFCPKKGKSGTVRGAWDAKFCCVGCRRKGNNNGKSAKQGQCFRCGERFTYFQNVEQKECSSCYARRREKALARKSVRVVYPKVCTECNTVSVQSFKPKKDYVCRPCEFTRSCKQCGIRYSKLYGNYKMLYCSPYCKDVEQAAARKAREKVHRRKYGSNNTQRAKQYGVEWERVIVNKVFERDNWTCQICGRKTPKSLRGTHKHNAPEIDHRIPMSKGGPHTYSNTQCACRKCNMNKGNKNERGQMPLFEIA